jgi:hypothetical protein
MDLGPSGEWAVELPESTSRLWQRSESGELSSSVEAETSSALRLTGAGFYCYGCFSCLC